MKTMTILASSVVFMVGGLGCATGATGAGGRARDVHASAVVSGGGEGRLLVAGPAVLLHVDVEGRHDVALYTVSAGDGTPADCSRAGDGQRTQVRRGHSNRINLRVGTGEVVCVGAPDAPGVAEVRWHARKLEPGLHDGAQLALDDHQR
jgi:hypothetical protein